MGEALIEAPILTITPDTGNFPAVESADPWAAYDPDTFAPSDYCMTERDWEPPFSFIRPDGHAQTVANTVANLHQLWCDLHGGSVPGDFSSRITDPRILPLAGQLVYALGVLSGSENHWSPEKALAVIEQTPLTHKGGILQAGPPEAVYQHDPHELRVVLAAKTRKQAPAPIASVVTDWAHRETAGFQGRAQTGFLTAYTEDIRPGEVQSPRPDVSSMLVKDNVTGEWLDPITWRKKQQRLRNFGNEMLPVDTFAEGQ